ncbi:YgaP-like transmembrane domain [Natrinema halophilum]|uniref:DUF2892 domain-containing protein n=1 Tax=Natrinema halophilum TaxID=1699371 RepID=A0A7D5L034_9EURY|nr:YgaP-like transmembrane domain [Natrinema halophilum]QLG50780.1 DUF2892 domain-containing protein [Natrinema halophilum]
MEKNVGGFDRVWRLVGGTLLVVIGAAALVGAVAVGPVVAAVMVVVGAVFFATGVLQRCIINRLLDLDTYRSDRTETTHSNEESTERPS